MLTFLAGVVVGACIVSAALFVWLIWSAVNLDQEYHHG